VIYILPERGVTKPRTDFLLFLKGRNQEKKKIRGKKGPLGISTESWEKRENFNFE